MLIVSVTEDVRLLGARRLFKLSRCYGHNWAPQFLRSRDFALKTCTRKLGEGFTSSNPLAAYFLPASAIIIAAWALCALFPAKVRVLRQPVEQLNRTTCR